MKPVMKWKSRRKKKRTISIKFCTKNVLNFLHVCFLKIILRNKKIPIAKSYPVSISHLFYKVQDIFTVRSMHIIVIKILIQF